MKQIERKYGQFYLIFQYQIYQLKILEVFKDTS